MVNAFSSLDTLDMVVGRWGRLSTLHGSNTLAHTIEMPMSAEGVHHHCGAAKTQVAHQTQFVMNCPQVVDDGPFVLSIFPTPWAVGITREAPEGLWVMNTF